MDPRVCTAVGRQVAHYQEVVFQFLNQVVDAICRNPCEEAVFKLTWALKTGGSSATPESWDSVLEEMKLDLDTSLKTANDVFVNPVSE